MPVHTPPPDNEEERLLCLRSLKLLNTPTEERFERLCRLARWRLQMPIVLVSLIDQDRLWFKSHLGIPGCEVPRESSFCACHMQQDNPLFIVEDTLQDPRFSDNVVVVNEPFVRFYAGYSLYSLRHLMLGTLCVLDRVPRTLNSTQKEHLKQIALLVEHELHSRELAEQ